MVSPIIFECAVPYLHINRFLTLEDVAGNNDSNPCKHTCTR